VLSVLPLKVSVPDLKPSRWKGPDKAWVNKHIVQRVISYSALTLGPAGTVAAQEPICARSMPICFAEDMAVYRIKGRSIICEFKPVEWWGLKVTSNG